MVKDKVKPLFKFLLTLCFVLLANYQTAGLNPQYDNLSSGITGKADTIIDRPGYALGYIEYHELPAWGIYVMTKEEAPTKEARRTNRFRTSCLPEEKSSDLKGSKRKSCFSFSYRNFFSFFPFHKRCCFQCKKIFR